MASKHMRRYLTSLVTRQMQNHNHFTRMAVIRQMKLSYIAGRTVKWCSLSRKVFDNSPKDLTVTMWLSNVTPRYVFKLKIVLAKNLHTNIH